MFSFEEIEVLKELDLLFEPVDYCVEKLQYNLEQAEDSFTKEFISELLVKFRSLDDEEYYSYCDAAKGGSF